MNNIKRKFTFLHVKNFAFSKNIFFFEKRYFCNNNKREKIKGWCEQTLPHVLLETEIFFELKGIFYRGLNIHELCEYATFDEIIFLFLYKRLPTSKELYERKCYFENAFHSYEEKKVCKIMENLQCSNPLELIRVCLLILSLQNEYNNDINLGYYDILAYSLKLIYLFNSKKWTSSNISNIKIESLCSFIIENFANNEKGISKNGTEKDAYDKEKGKMKSGQREIKHVKKTSLELYDSMKKEKTKVLTILLMLICENGINEKTFLLRMLYNVSKDNHFNIFLYAVTFYIDTFKKIDLHTAFRSLLSVKLPSKDKAEYEKDKILSQISNMNLFFYNNKFFFKKNAILKKYLENYCRMTSQANVDILTHFIDIENFFLKNKKKYASSYYYTLLTFHLLDISLEYLPPLYFLARLLSFTAHINEQTENNKIVKYSGVYIGNTPIKYVDASNAKELGDPTAS
ncbi:citrate synthase-like protein, putative [Plasmodium malariae]|uniref:Citrate synthase-like protein, putative n=1 Tax=Plasmodium malariae TaxID=5858 RepID=A0A1C3KZY4_PLAMA|nr:citrate synthase-like protein, putative [Plasmodium malariae]